MNTKLGICIPTYKRPDQLQLCVRSIIAAARSHDVPIFIADDSADSTNAQTLEQLKKEYHHIYVVLNQKNLGIDGNIVNAVNICECEYAWLLGEDDRMQPHGIDTVLSLLTKDHFPNYPFIYTNYASVDDAIQYYLNPRALPLKEDTIKPAEYFLTHHSWAAAFIGGCIIRTETWQTVEHEKYMGTYFAHVGSILESIAGNKVYLVADSLILNRCGEPRLFTWSDSTFDVAGGWKKMMSLLEGVYTKALCDQATELFENAHGLYTYKFLCYARADYAYRMQHYHQYLRPFGKSKTYMVIAKIIALTPPHIFRAIRYGLTLYRKYTKPAVNMV